MLTTVPGRQPAPWMTKVVFGSPSGFSETTPSFPAGIGGKLDGTGRITGGGDSWAAVVPCEPVARPDPPDMLKPVRTAPRAAPATISTQAATARPGRLSVAAWPPRDRRGPVPGAPPGGGSPRRRTAAPDA